MGDVGEYPSFKGQSGNPFLVHRMRTDFHETMGTALIHHLGHHLVELQRIRCCM